MGKGGDPVPENGVRSLSWDEVRQHDKKNDKWIVIDGAVYDISNFARKHPGGERIIGHYAGQDATEAFREFHPTTKLVRRYMPNLEIGQLPSKSSPKSSDDDIKQAFLEIRKKAEEMNLFTPSKVFFILQFAHIIFFDVLAYLIMRNYGTGWLPYLGSMICLLISLSQAGWLQHDFGHLSVFSSNKINHAFHSVTMNIMKGASSSWWKHLHNQHHSKPNVIMKDPDVKLDPVFVVGDTIPKKMAEKRTSPMPYNWQHLYFFAIGPPLLFPIYFQYMVFKHPLVRGHYMDVCIMMLFYVKFFFLYAPFLGFFGALGFFFLTRCLESHWFVWVSQSNHIPMDIEDDLERPWLPLQLYATCDVDKSFFNDWFTGHLNFQIEHHLFPTMPRHNLYKIQPMVREMCRKHGIPYQCKSLSQAFGDVVRSLKRSGEIWEKHYHQLTAK
jgi:fatty acid desaturase 2 (delta-6 desaturase)